MSGFFVSDLRWQLDVGESLVGRTRSFFEMGIFGIGFGQGVDLRSSVGCFSISMDTICFDM